MNEMNLFVRLFCFLLFSVVYIVAVGCIVVFGMNLISVVGRLVVTTILLFFLLLFRQK